MLQHLNTCQPTTKAIKAFNQTFREAQKFFEHARMASVVTIHNVKAVKAKLEKAVGTLRYRTVDLEIEPETKMDMRQARYSSK
jgi:hypothetical protein